MSLDQDTLLEPYTKFINTWPLYSPFEIQLPDSMSYSPGFPPTILRECSTCDARPTWARRHPAQSPESGNMFVGIGEVVAYKCTHCNKEDMRFWYFKTENHSQKSDSGKSKLTSFVLRKVGQWPAQSVNPSRQVEKALGATALDFFKKGLTSLSHGFGVGALAYFRRVVEEATGTVLDLFADQAQTDGELEAEKAIRAAKQNRQMEEQLRIAAESLPLTLRPGGVNPLSVLYDYYSRGIHGLSDEQCLEVAQELDVVFEYIFKNWRLQMKDASKFRATINRFSNPNKSANSKT